MPATSQVQQRFMGAELARKRAGKPTRTGMSEAQLSDFASTKRTGLPKRAGERGKKMAAAIFSRKKSAPAASRAVAAAKSGNTPKHKGPTKKTRFGGHMAAMFGRKS
jgi:hypothetical protein